MAMPLRSSGEMFEEARRIQQRLEGDFDRYDQRQAHFRKRFAAEARKHHEAICDTACSASQTPSSLAALFFAEHEDDPSEDEIDVEESKDGQRAAIPGCQAVYSRRDKDDKHAAVFRALSCFYNPPDAATDIVCELCFGFRSAELVPTLPSPWVQHLDDATNTHYFYHARKRQVRWSPPPRTDPLGVLVFERTNSVFSVCHCIPSKERRRRLMQKFREHALQMARQEAEKRDRHLRGAFISLTMSLVTPVNAVDDEFNI